ncbi:MAG: hypothetical protein O3B70_05685 [Bacteroidetes bacterium]|nr:hypothetical protein [Bacteroidota bacterium]MDA0903810.1 hypothetical protein [Bacteroidota bacterium]MDA1242510.1 hypothetical protein [Bacteroidota bacterium]
MNSVGLWALALVLLGSFATGWGLSWWTRHRSPRRREGDESTSTSSKATTIDQSRPRPDMDAPAVHPPLDLLQNRFQHARDVGMRHRELAIQFERKAQEWQQVQTLEHIREHIARVLIELEQAMDSWVRESGEDVTPHPLSRTLSQSNPDMARDHVEWLLEITSKTLRHALDICRSEEWEWQDLQPKLTHIAQTLEALHAHTNERNTIKGPTPATSRAQDLWNSDWLRISEDAIVDGPDMLLALLRMQPAPEANNLVTEFQASQPSK